MKVRTLLILIFLILLIGIILLMNSVDTSKNKYKIIKNFKNNIELFEKSIQELENEKTIDFNRYGEIIVIEYINDEGELVKIKEENYYKYEQTISLINLLELREAYKTNDSIIFIFSNSFYPGSKEIAYIPNLKYDMWKSNKVREKEQIDGNWYYVVIESL